MKELTSEQDKARRKWLIKHARRIVCPICRNSIQVEIIDDHTLQCPCICPKCGKLWIYKLLNIEEIRSKWRASWRYHERQL